MSYYYSHNIQISYITYIQVCYFTLPYNLVGLEMLKLIIFSTNPSHLILFLLLEVVFVASGCPPHTAHSCIGWFPSSGLWCRAIVGKGRNCIDCKYNKLFSWYQQSVPQLSLLLLLLLPEHHILEYSAEYYPERLLLKRPFHCYSTYPSLQHLSIIWH